MIHADPIVEIIVGLLVVPAVMYVVFGMLRWTRGDSDGARLRRPTRRARPVRRCAQPRRAPTYPSAPWA